MIKEAIDRILSLSPMEKVSIENRDYYTKTLYPLARPIPVRVTVQTLAALVSLFHANFESMASGIPAGETGWKAGPIFHVVDYGNVSVYGNFSDEYATRTIYAEAKLPSEQQFRFNDWLTQEQFIIGVNSFFLDYGNKLAILQVVSKLETDDRLMIEDDGISQTATAKQGLSRNTQLEIKPRVVLKPFRTFREVEQPASEFILRVKRGKDGQPMIALFEADGARWKLEAAANIAEYIRSKIPADGATVVA